MSERLERLGAICRANGVALAYLFGSQAEAGERALASDGAADAARRDPLADLDLGVVTLEPLPAPGERPTFYSRLYGELSDLLPGFRLDLVLLEEGHSLFQVEAILGRCVYAASEGVRDQYEQRILARAADFRPFLELFYKERFEEARP